VTQVGSSGEYKDIDIWTGNPWHSFASGSIKQLKITKLEPEEES